MRYARFSDHVWRDFNRCEYAMRELRYTFGYNDGHNDHGRNDDHRGQSTINRPGRLALEIK